MKKMLLIVGVLSVMASCGPNYREQAEALQFRFDSLSNVHDLKSNELTAYMQDLNEIQTSISKLVQEEQILKNKAESDLTMPAREIVLNDLAVIRNAIVANKRKLASVQSKLKAANTKIASLEDMIGNLNAQLVIRDSSINVLSQTIADLSLKVNSVEIAMAEVKADNETKSKELAEKTNKLNTAYYTIGNIKSLRDKQVISNEGTIFKSKNVDPNFNRDAFTKIDITSTKVIALNNVKDAKLASAHPSDSYTVVKENDKIKSIEVTDPEKFWSNSKYLVVITN